MTILKSFAQYMQDTLSCGTVGQDIFLNSVPKDAADKAPDKAWWLKSSGGAPIVKNHTGEKQKNYIVYVYYRNTDSEDVDEILQAFEESINSKNCTQLPGYTTIEMSATGFQNDLDIDNEERTVGLVEVTITTYQQN